MWQLGLTGGESYPERPGVPNCVYYMRTGQCGYGVWCRYNHPRDRAAVAAAVRATREYPERVGEPVCQNTLEEERQTQKTQSTSSLTRPNIQLPTIDRQKPVDLDAHLPPSDDDSPDDDSDAGDAANLDD
ncbi:Zinc finger CCCH domain-containing protein 32 [Morus notabilis]|uniref:Zinc finger CCCH domain-containing protein 32 n=1 Tax=Morus notabilis TaxID=981085 RepID=W9QQ15_9ROSA|nr:Zinc finger CCCH domain-containing protein 32 [Morus notabilis]